MADDIRMALCELLRKAQMGKDADSPREGVRLVTSDAHEGLKGAIAAVLQGGSCPA